MEKELIKKVISLIFAILVAICNFMLSFLVDNLILKIMDIMAGGLWSVVVGCEISLIIFGKNQK